MCSSDLYAALRAELAAIVPLGWCLRRFERDLLEALGLGLAWGQTAEGDALDPAARYRIDPERGAWRDRSHGVESLRGSALLALAEDRCPPAEELAELRALLATSGDTRAVCAARGRCAWSWRRRRRRW